MMPALMSRFRLAASLLLLTGACASGSESGDPVDAARIDTMLVPIDGAVDVAIDTPDTDAAIDAAIDAPAIDAAIDAPPVDAAIDAPLPIDAPIDAPLPIDAPPCTPGTTQLLVNPAFDLAPEGTGWLQMPFDALYPPITTDQLASPAPDTPTRHAWLGGFDSATDSIEQTVTIPAGTTSLVLRGRRATITNETTTTTVYDTSTVDLMTTTGTVIENAVTVTNLTASATYASWLKTFATPHAGETVKVRLRSTTDVSQTTNFFYDSLALEATTSCP